MTRRQWLALIVLVPLVVIGGLLVRRSLRSGDVVADIELGNASVSAESNTTM